MAADSSTGRTIGLGVLTAPRTLPFPGACEWNGNPAVDEPVAGMSDAETAETAELLRDINRTRSLVVVEHDMAFVRALGVKVTVLHEGSVLAEGSIDEIQDDPRVIEVYLGR